MKKGKILWMAVIAAMVLVPTMSWGQTAVATQALDPSFMIELYAGGGSGSSATKLFRELRPFNSALFNTDIRAYTEPYVLGGLKFGYWFNPRGTYGIAALPDWMKYVGVYTDFSYQKLNYGNSTGAWSVPNLNLRGHLGVDSSGSLITWALMFAARYGFMPDSVVPFGRLQPYIAAGPAIFFSNQDPTFNLQTVNGANLGIGFNPADRSSINIGLAAESGLRYFFNKSISVQASFKYRYFAPKYTHSGYTNINNVIAIPYSVTSKPNYNLYSGQIGVAYHF